MALQAELINVPRRNTPGMVRLNDLPTTAGYFYALNKSPSAAGTVGVLLCRTSRIGTIPVVSAFVFTAHDPDCASIAIAD